MFLPKYQKTVEKATIPFATVLFWLGIVLTLVCGWCLNIYEVYTLISNGGTITCMFIFRCVGIIFAPLGGILGWI